MNCQFTSFAIIILLIKSIICPPPLVSYRKPINIGYAIDNHSAKDLLISIQSILTTSYDKNNINFYILACDNNINDSIKLQKLLNDSIFSCYNQSIHYTIIPFTLPKESGFYLQMINSKRKSHWTSPSGADMARFYMPSIFPNLERLLYIDNDVLITCCLEEIWSTYIDDNKIIGIALDDLKWATVTQFQRQYNNSHPLVIQNIRRPNNYNSSDPITEKEFWKALPRYPNDGVLLIDIDRYNNKTILKCMNEIAMANGLGEYVVGLGTQQFTVLCLHDRWIELSPRANLRHFPDMARGYLMWFLYNGFIHYAGQSKPRHICHVNGHNIDNEHRMQTYTPWVTTVYQLHDICPNQVITLLDVVECWNHIPTTDSIDSLIQIVQSILLITTDPSLIYIKFGVLSNYLSKDNINTSSNLIEYVDRMILFNSSLSGYIFNNIDSHTTESMTTLSNTKYSRDVTHKNSYLNDIKRRPKNKETLDTTREWLPITLDYCIYTKELDVGNDRSLPIQSSKCKSVLLQIKSYGKKHWDVIGISIDLPTIDLTIRPIHILRALDFEFMRPRFILIKVIDNQLDRLINESKEIVVILIRNGFISNQIESIQFNNSNMYTYIWGTRINSFDINNSK